MQNTMPPYPMPSNFNNASHYDLPPTLHSPTPRKKGFFAAIARWWNAGWWQKALFLLLIPALLCCSCCSVGVIFDLSPAGQQYLASINATETVIAANDTRATATPTEAPSPTPTIVLKWKLAHTFQGDPNKDNSLGTYFTEPFQLKGPWKVHWVCGGDGLICELGVGLYNIDGSPTGEVTVDNVDNNTLKGDSQVFTNTGDFIFKVFALQQWTVQLYEYE